MKFAQCIFVVDTKLGEGSPRHSTNVILTESEVDDKIVAESAISGQSPRVRYQSVWRNSGKIPSEITMSWSDWFGKPVRVRTEKQTDEQIIAGLKSDPIRLQRYLSELGFEVKESE